MGRRILVVGAGPKAVGIAAKASAMDRHGLDVPEIEIWDMTGIATNWQGNSGYTDGDQPLGTSPEKDLGFPYTSSASWWDEDDSDEPSASPFHEGMVRYSWMSYLIAQGRWAAWVDSGRPQPSHRRWGNYIRWVARKAEEASEKVSFRIGLVEKISLRDGNWYLTIQDQHGKTIERRGDGLVLTGPGRARRIAGQPDDHPRIFDGKTFWQAHHSLGDIVGQPRVAVIGSGETAASAAIKTVSMFGSRGLVDIISPYGMIYSRGESTFENALFTTPGSDWQKLSLEHRREFILRTDRTVFSRQAMEALRHTTRLKTLAGYVERLEASENNVYLDIRYCNALERHAYDVVVVSIGFDPLSLFESFGDSAREALVRCLDKDFLSPQFRDELALKIDHDLSVRGLGARLHLPMVSGLSQGPGFSNLSCLGVLSDRILESYLTPSSQPMEQRSPKLASY